MAENGVNPAGPQRMPRMTGSLCISGPIMYEAWLRHHSIWRKFLLGLGFLVIALLVIPGLAGVGMSWQAGSGPAGADPMTMARTFCRFLGLVVVLNLLAVGFTERSRKRAEAALRESEQRLALALEKSHTGAWEFDLGVGHTAYHEPELARIFGYNPSAGAWKFVTFLEHVIPEDRSRVSDHFRESLAAKTDWNLECRIRRADGEIRWIGVAGGPLGAVKGQPSRMAGIIQDITGRKRAELEIRSLEAQVNHLQRLESIGRLAGGISHDINNVLAVIMAVGSTLKVRHGDDPVLVKEAEILLNVAARGRDLVKGLRDFSRKDLESAAELDLNQLARQEADLLDHTALKKVAVDLDLEEGLPRVYGEASAIANALMNLCLNACDAMQHGGKLSLATRSLGQGFVELAVQDQGEGMAPKILAQAMDPFFTTKPAGKGTGLGLSQVYGTMKAHGGTLGITSTPGLGTRVSLVFPPVVDIPSVMSFGEAVAASSARMLRILLVDDEELVRRTVAALFEALGHQVQTVAGGMEAIRRLEAGLETDLVILDLNMPELDGSETFRRLRAIRPELPVVFATGYVNDLIPPILSHFPKVRLLKKPFTLSEIQEVLSWRLDTVGRDFHLQGVVTPTFLSPEAK